MGHWVRGLALASAMAGLVSGSPAVASDSDRERIRVLEAENASLRDALARLEGGSKTHTAGKESEPAASSEDEIDAQFAFSIHRDTRRFSTLGIVTSLRNLPFGLSVWGFTDLHGQHDGERWIDVARSFSEYRLSKPLPFLAGLGLQAEVNDGSRVGDSLARFGVTYRHEVSFPGLDLEASPGWLQWRAFPVDTTGDGAQLSWIYHLPLTERLSLGGFADYNFLKGANRWVIEPELRYRVWKNLSLLLEYRWNEFESAAPGLRGQGVAIGLKAAL